MGAYRDLVAGEVYDQYQGPTRRRTEADIVVMPLGGFFHCRLFRDVYKVDGHAVHDRVPRLERLFESKGDSAMERALQHRDPYRQRADAAACFPASRARAQAHARAIAEFELNTPAASIKVEYRPEPSLSIWVPSKMQEEYPGLRATAHYSEYRRFSVETEETVHLPQPR
jgi:hypothetical protein